MGDNEGSAESKNASKVTTVEFYRFSSHIRVELREMPGLFLLRTNRASL